MNLKLYWFVKNIKGKKVQKKNNIFHFWFFIEMQNIIETS